MNFAHPEAFLLFIPLILVFIFTQRIGVRLRSRIFYPTDSWMKQRPRFSKPTPFKVHLILRTLALSFIIVALARPQEHAEKVKRTVDAIDMVICFDLSKSMDALDFKPNRRTVAINTISSFIDRRADDRIGLVLFSGEAYMAVPMTLDHDILKDAIRRSSNNQLQDGTAIGQSLAVAVSHLRTSSARSRIVVLVTDGDNNMGSVDPMTAATLAAGYGIKIYAIGIGKKGRVAFPVVRKDALGREFEELQYLTDAANDELLQNIAKTANGQFFSATEQKMLGEIFGTIDRLEKTKIETQSFTLVHEKAWPWILMALLLMTLEFVALHTRWRKIP
jgi:Ca-activated chloride channel family protein